MGRLNGFNIYGTTTLFILLGNNAFIKCLLYCKIDSMIASLLQGPL